MRVIMRSRKWCTPTAAIVFVSNCDFFLPFPNTSRFNDARNFLFRMLKHNISVTNVNALKPTVCSWSRSTFCRKVQRPTENPCVRPDSCITRNAKQSYHRGRSLLARHICVSLSFCACTIKYEVLTVINISPWLS
jgi:hypothetical protein